MLTYAFKELRTNSYDNIAGEDFENIHDLFAEILAKGIAYQLKQGLHREYIEKTENLSTLRGKICINGTLRNYAAQRRKLDCTYDVLSEDNVFNQILKSSMELLLKHPSVAKERKVALRKLMVFFDNVSEIHLGDVAWDRLRFDRNSKTYQMLIYLCYFIAENNILTTEAGEYRMKSFTDEHMNMLFQRFVLEYYKQKFPKLKAYAGQVKWDCIEELSTTTILPLMQTDIMLYMNDRTLIIDTKYYSKTMQTHFDKKTIHSHNYHQIFTYVNSLDWQHTGKVDGMLLYAKTDEDIVANGQQVQHDGNTIYFRTIDLNQDFSKIEEQLKMENILAPCLEQS